VSAGRLPTVHGVQADVVELEQLDDAGVEWFAVGPAGEAIGALAEVLPAAIGSGGEADWIAAVIAAIEREPEAGGHRRSQLLVMHLVSRHLRREP
jgi:hypothetical protein